MKMSCVDVDKYAWMVNANVGQNTITEIMMTVDDVTANAYDIVAASGALSLEYNYYILSRFDSTHSIDLDMTDEDTNTKTVSDLTVNLGRIWVLEWNNGNCNYYEDDADNWSDLINNTVDDKEITKNVSEKAVNYFNSFISE